MHEMVIYGVSFDLVGKQPIVLLKTADGNKFLPIWIGHPEAAAILMKLQGASTPRPMTHDLVSDIIGQLDAQVVRITVTENDPLIRQLREQISDNDRAIVEAINARLKLVARLKGYKESRGLSFVDPDREQWMLQYLARANRGPLSSDGLQELFEEVLDLTKREVQRGEEP